MKVYLVSIGEFDYDVDNCEHVGVFETLEAATGCLVSKGAVGPWRTSDPPWRASWTSLASPGPSTKTGYIEEFEVMK